MISSAIQVILGVVLLPGYAGFWLWELLMTPTMAAFDAALTALEGAPDYRSADGEESTGSAA